MGERTRLEQGIKDIKSEIVMLEQAANEDAKQLKKNERGIRCIDQLLKLKSFLKHGPVTDATSFALQNAIKNTTKFQNHTLSEIFDNQFELLDVVYKLYNKMDKIEADIQNKTLKDQEYDL